MATTRDERVPVSREDLLAAINPPQKTPEELYELALDSIVADWRAGHITADEAEALLQELMSARVHYEVRGMIKDTFSPDFGRRDSNAPRRRFSLL